MRRINKKQKDQIYQEKQFHKFHSPGSVKRQIGKQTCSRLLCPQRDYVLKPFLLFPLEQFYRLLDFESIVNVCCMLHLLKV